MLNFCFCISDEVMTTFIREAAIASLKKSETFYVHALGMPELREAIAVSSDGLRPAGAVVLRAEHIAVT